MTAYSALNRDQLLPLPDGRQIAFDTSGTPNSSKLVIFFHGMFGVGFAEDPSPALVEEGVFYITPTLPGWGNTSPSPVGMPFAQSVIADTAALVSHLYPDANTIERIYIAGGSYGTVPAQIVYGAPYNLFPYGAKIHGLLLLAPFSPFRLHEGYAKVLPWETYMSVGPPAYYTPFDLLSRTVKLFFKTKLATIDGAESFARSVLFDNMDEQEKEAYAHWREKRGAQPGTLERRFGEMIHKSVSQSWSGYSAVVPAIHSDWLFDPRSFPENHHGANRGNVLVVYSPGDWRVPQALAKWIAANYPGGRLREMHGGHLSAMWEMDKIWEDFLHNSSA
jgi:pimeloyl-ACP methyl ester carboxylesterase